MKLYQKRIKLSTWIKAFIFAAAVIIFKELLTSLPAVFGVVNTVFKVLTPFIVGFAIAFILYLPCFKLESLLKKAKKLKFISKHGRGLAVITVYILCLGIIAVVLALVLPWIVRNLIGIYDNRNAYYETVKNYVYSRCDANGKLFGIDPNPVIELINPEAYLSNINIDKLTSIANGVYKFGSAVISSLLAVFSSIYMLISREMLVRAFGKFLTLFTAKEKVLRLHGYLGKIVNIFYSYIYSTLIDALIVAVVCVPVFFIIGVDYAPLFAFAVGVSNLIPYFGAIIMGVVTAGFTAITDGFVKAIIVAVAVLIIQQIDGNIIQPRIFGKNVGIHPLATLIAITVGGSFFGFFGILLAVPVTATLFMILTDVMESHDKSVAVRAKTEAEDEDGETEEE